MYTSTIEVKVSSRAWSLPTGEGWSAGQASVTPSWNMKEAGNKQ